MVALHNAAVLGSCWLFFAHSCCAMEQERREPNERPPSFVTFLKHCRVLSDEFPEIKTDDIGNLGDVPFNTPCHCGKVCETLGAFFEHTLTCVAWDCYRKTVAQRQPNETSREKIEAQQKKIVPRSRKKPSTESYRICELCGCKVDCLEHHLESKHNALAWLQYDFQNNPSNRVLRSSKGKQ